MIPARAGWSDSLQGYFERDVPSCFVDLEPGAYPEAFDVLTAYRADSITRLVERGLDKQVAEAVTKFIGSDSAHSIYHIDNVGNLVADGRIMAQGQVLHSLSPVLYSELFKGVIQMPNPRLIRHAANELDAFGRRMNWIATQGIGQAGTDGLFRQRVVFRVTNNIMTKYWKPSVLLRIAWPVRVVGEEQARLLAAGSSQILTHPIHWISRVIHSKSSTDVVGDLFTEGERFSAAGAGRLQFQGDYRAWGQEHWTTLRRSDVSHSEYREALLKELRQHWTDPITRRLFRGNKPGTVVDNFEDTVKWLDTDEAGMGLLDDLMRNADPATRKKIYDEGPRMRTDTIRMHVQQVNARAHQKAGGNWRLIRAEALPDGTNGGRWVDANGETGWLSPDEIVPARPTYEIIEPGIDELLESYGTSKFRDIRVADRMADTKKALKDDPSLTDANLVRRELDKLMNSADGDRLPAVLKGTRKFSEIDSNRADEIVNFWFDILMSKPTNRLSRHPTFAVEYYRFLGEMAPLMDAATLKAARAGAKDAATQFKIPGGALRQFDTAAKTARKQGGRSAPAQADLITSLKAADETAKAMALTKVQDLLFDVSKRHNVADALSITMPFAEAWGEVITTWAKIMRQENLRPFRRFQQVIESGRESNMFDPASGYTNEGFFYEDANGREVFTVPFANKLFEAVSGVEAEWEYGLGSLSIATSTLPATGPAVSFPAQAIIPDEPGWNWLREMIAPFGATSIQRGLTPSSWQRLIAAFEWSRNTFADQALIDTYNGSVADALAAMERDDPEGFKERLRTNEEGVMTEARATATQLFVIQALARFVGPAAPSTRPTAEDKNGKVYQTSILHDEYFKISEKHKGDRIATHEEFVGKYGISPFGITTAKSTEIEPRGESAISYNWQRENKDLFDQWGSVAYYLGPAWLDDVVEFEWNAYYASILEGSRERNTPEEFLAQMNDAKAQLIYANQKRLYEEAAGREWNDAGWPTGLKKELAIELRNTADELMREYPGYTGPGFRSGVAGIPTKVSTETQISDLLEIVAQRPDLLLADSETGEPVNAALYAASLYLEARELINNAAQKNDVDRSTTAMEKGQSDPDSMFYKFRQLLRQKAAELIVRYPEFGPLWEGVLGRELINDDDEEMTIENAYEIIYGETNG